MYATSDFIEFIIWAYMVFQNKRWDRNSFYPVNEYIEQLPNAIRNEMKILLSSNKMEELTKASESIIEDFKHQLLAKNAKLPIANSIEEGVQFLRVEIR